MGESEIERAFTSTHYRVKLGDTTHTLAIDSSIAAALTPWLTRYAGSAPAWLITAHNPCASAAEPAANAARNAVLKQWLAARDVALLETVNADPRGTWPDEPGWLVAGLEEGAARALARRFGQLAIVAVAAARRVDLVWL